MIFFYSVDTCTKYVYSNNENQFIQFSLVWKKIKPRILYTFQTGLQFSWSLVSDRYEGNTHFIGIPVLYYMPDIWYILYIFALDACNFFFKMLIEKFVNTAIRL